MQEIPLRGQLDSGPMKTEGNNEFGTCAKANYSNFRRTLLHLRMESGDGVLKNHLDTCTSTHHI